MSQTLNSQPSGVPTGFHTLTPYLYIPNAAQAIEFYKKAFDALVHLSTTYPNGAILHAEIQIGESMIMLTEANPHPSNAAPAGQLPPFDLFLYVADSQRWIDRAVQTGATLVAPAEMHDEGDLRGGVKDPFGITWWIATQKIVKSRAELQQMYDERAKTP